MPKPKVLDQLADLEYAVKNVSTDNVKLSDKLANELGLVLGSDLSTLLINQYRDTSNTLASAEVIE